MNHIPHRIPWNLDVSLRTYQSNVHGFFALFAIHLNSSRWLCLRFAHFRFQDVCDCCHRCWRRRQQWLWRSHEYISKMFTEDKFHLNSIFSARSSWLCEMEEEEKEMEGIGEARAKCASCVRVHVRFAVITLARQFRVKYFSFLPILEIIESVLRTSHFFLFPIICLDFSVSFFWRDLLPFNELSHYFRLCANWAIGLLIITVCAEGEVCELYIR